MDMLSEMEKQMISRPSSTKGCMTSMASVREGAEVLGVVLFSSDHRKISSGVISTPSRYSSSPSRMCRGRMVMSYFSTNSFDRSQVLSEMILTVCAIESTFLPIISSPKSLIFGLFSLNSYLTTSAKVHEHSLYQVLNS